MKRKSHRNGPVPNNNCLEILEGTILVESWGEKGIFYNPGHVLKRGVYILTVKEKDLY